MASQSFEKIKVFARLKPSDIDRSQKVVKFDKNEIVVNLNDDPKHFCFDGVFGEESNQEEVFNGAASRIVQGTLQGYNGTIFAYGQTGSGKTHTMIGPPKSASTKSITTFDEESGIIPRSLHKLFDMLNKKKMDMPEIFSFNVSISFVEIYNENIYDLFEMNDEKLKIGQDNDGNAMVKGTTEKVVKDFNDAMEEVKRGWNNRSVASTEMNRTSSRSHALLLIKIHTGEVKIDAEDGSISHSHSAFLNLVDLAGSERVSQSKVEGERLKETCCINKSLHTLTSVIRELSKKPRTHFISFRNSVLTHILKDSLGGNARTAVMINVHSDKMYYSETLSTLQFSAEVSRIQNKVEANEKLEGDSVSAYKVAIRRLQDEIDKIHTTNAEERAELQRSLDAWKKAALRHESLSKIRKEESELRLFEKDDMEVQLDLERISKREMHERFTKIVKVETSQEKKPIEKAESPPAKSGATGAFYSMLGYLFTPSSVNEEWGGTRRIPLRERQIDHSDGDGSNQGNSKLRETNDRREMELEDKMNSMARIIEEKSQECERLSRRLKEAEERIYETGEKWMDAVNSNEKEKEKSIKMKREMEEKEKTIGEMRVKVYEMEKREVYFNEELIAANAQIDRLTSDMSLLKSIHDDKMKELEMRMKSSLSDKEKKETDLNAEIDRLREQIESAQITMKKEEFEKKEREDIVSRTKEGMATIEKEMKAKIGELELANSHMEGLVETMGVEMKEMEEERRKSENRYKEKMSALEGELEFKKLEIEEERRKSEERHREHSRIIEEEIEKKRKELEGLRCLLMEREQIISEVEDKWKHAVESCEEAKQKTIELTTQMQHAEKMIGETREKEVDLTAEIDRLREEIECRRIDQLNKETEKKEVDEILKTTRDQLEEAEKEKRAKIEELESATSQIHELMEAMHNNKEKMEEERMKSEKEHEEKIRAMEEELELKKKEIEEERKKTTQIEITSSEQGNIQQEESLQRADIVERDDDFDLNFDLDDYQNEQVSGNSSVRREDEEDDDDFVGFVRPLANTFDEAGITYRLANQEEENEKERKREKQWTKKPKAFKKPKEPKNPKEPKKPRTAYAFWRMGGKKGEEWKNIVDRTEWERKAEEDKFRYASEIRVFTARKQHC